MLPRGENCVCKAIETTIIQGGENDGRAISIADSSSRIFSLYARYHMEKHAGQSWNDWLLRAVLMRNHEVKADHCSAKQIEQINVAELTAVVIGSNKLVFK
jgi:hypothetical protein